MHEAAMETILATRPCGLLTDIDGTISRIAPTPEAAVVSDAAREHLRTLAEHLEIVGAISGRAAADAASLVGLDELVYVGNHGMEVWRDGEARPSKEAAAYMPAIGATLAEAQAAITLPGVLFEDKSVTASVHYRLTDDPEAAGEAIGAVLERLAERYGLRLTRGRLVWEIRPPLEVNKGTAVRSLAREYELRGLIFLGDDRTDADAFAALRSLRESGECATLNVGVLADETPDVIREQADLLVDGVAGVESLLARAAAIVAGRHRAWSE
jgi:trehalose 6-phosphate phosphatase